MAQNKPLFIPWLRQQIDSALYPGVNWLNPERTLFTVPWKHALRQDSNSDDVRIFKAWARTSVNSGEMIPGDSSVWKRNFRSALRARGFKMYQDNKNDTANPHKIFKWPEDGQSGGDSRESSQDYDGNFPLDALDLDNEILFRDGAQAHQILEECLQGLNITQPEQESVGVVDPYLLGGSAGADLYSAAAPAASCLLNSPVSEVFSDQAVGGLGHISPAEASAALGQFSPLEGAFTGTQDPLPVQDTANDSGINNFPTHYNVSVYYRGSKVLEQLVENETGFRIMFRNDLGLMTDTLPVIRLPDTDSILDQTQASSTRDILVNLGGLEVRKKSGVVFGHRWGDSRVFWGLCKHERTDQPRPLAKIHPEPIYHFKDFCTGIMDFMHYKGSSPSYTLYFFLGQNWPDPKRKPWEKKLIMVEVVLTSLERLKMMAVENGASSLQSDELQLSLEQMMELC
ncbi:interferon regulatory factor 3 [Astyanax mexicanus]|uniref:interferon regulatory factor 3 n=1 Tax=Astyanax mexicanus TaxID=7994 RepID=UPI0020CAB7B1|nr:interferon regulatory factor 3 [Astyanax mexicanus]XP_007248792.3 interferon regulatory factor 3 [Astyanax mexicanus]